VSHATESDVVGAVARTALWTAAARAREHRRPDRLFSDPFAALLAGTDGPALLQHFHTPHASREGNPFLPIRTRWFDDFLAGALAEGPRQVVALGAGLDTRAFRCSWPEGTVLFEIDQPELLRYKERVLGEHGVAAGCERRLLEVDLAGDWTPALRAAGYRPAEPSVWFAEGVLFYLPPEAAVAVLGTAAVMAARGTRLAVDLIGTGVFRFPYTRVFLERLAAAGSPWQFGTDDPAGVVAASGWDVVRLDEPGRPGADYGRWPAPATARGSDGLPRSFLVSARRPE